MIAVCRANLRLLWTHLHIPGRTSVEGTCLPTDNEIDCYWLVLTIYSLQLLLVNIDPTLILIINDLVFTAATGADRDTFLDLSEWQMSYRKIGS